MWSLDLKNMSVKEDYLGNRVNSRGWGGGTKE
jgi:hypothetical protein